MITRRSLLGPAVNSSRICVRSITSKDIEDYKKNPAQPAQWLDFAIIKENGRAFDADRAIYAKEKAYKFPPVLAYTLKGEEKIFPDQAEGTVKLVAFSFKEFGSNLLRSWMDPFIAKYGSTGHLSRNAEDLAHSEHAPVFNQAVTVEICFVEYKFLSFAKTLFANTLKKTITDPGQQGRTGYVFGNIQVKMLALTLTYLICTFQSKNICIYPGILHFHLC
jgi:hypothetical protein